MADRLPPNGYSPLCAQGPPYPRSLSLNGQQQMNVLGELHAVAAKRSRHDDRATCEGCGQGKLDLIDERPDPIFGALGMTCQTLKCDFLECGKLSVV